MGGQVRLAAGGLGRSTLAVGADPVSEDFRSTAAIRMVPADELPPLGSTRRLRRGDPSASGAVVQLVHGVTAGRRRHRRPAGSYSPWVLGGDGPAGRVTALWGGGRGRPAARSDCWSPRPRVRCAEVR